MDTTNEPRNDQESEEYVPPVIVDYGTLVEVTQSNAQNKLSDYPIGNSILGWSHIE